MWTNCVGYDAFDRQNVTHIRVHTPHATKNEIEIVSRFRSYLVVVPPCDVVTNKSAEPKGKKVQQFPWVVVDIVRLEIKEKPAETYKKCTIYMFRKPYFGSGRMMGVRDGPGGCLSICCKRYAKCACELIIRLVEVDRIR